MQKVKEYTFTADIVLERSMSPNVENLGRAECTMTLYDSDDDAGRGWIEWDIPSLETGEEIGLWYKMTGTKRELRDYDGVFALPKEAVELLRKADIIVPKEFEE